MPVWGRGVGWSQGTSGSGKQRTAGLWGSRMSTLLAGGTEHLVFLFAGWCEAEGLCLAGAQLVIIHLGHSKGLSRIMRSPRMSLLSCSSWG